MSWDTSLDIASFRGHAFETLSVNDSLTHRYAEYKFPYKNGAKLDDLGREPRRTTLTAVFFGSEYEKELRDFIVLVDEGKTGTFAHPILGSWQAKCNINNITHNPDDRDAAEVELEFIEDGTSTKIPELNSINKLQKDVYTFSAELITLDSTDELTDAATDALTFAQKVDNATYDIISHANQLRKKIDTAIKSVRDSVTGSEQYQALLALNKMAYSVQKLSTRTQSEVSQAYEKTINVELPIVLVAHQVYGDWKRAGELTSTNRIRNPFLVTGGTKLKVYTS